MDFTIFVTKYKGLQVDVLYTDFMKAFDKVNHCILLKKLNNFDLPINLLRWKRSYLENRRQYVMYEGMCSRDFVVNSGVPQGSHIGPTLFLLFINDLANILNDDVFSSLFADDLKIAAVIKSPTDVTKLQSAIDKLRTWCTENDLHLNLSKCVVMSITKKNSCFDGHYHYGSHMFERVYHQKDLGVIIDSKLMFSEHINSITSKAASTLGFLKRFCYNICD